MRVHLAAALQRRVRLRRPPSICARNYRKYRKWAEAGPSPAQPRASESAQRPETQAGGELASVRVIAPDEGRGPVMVARSTAPAITGITGNGLHLAARCPRASPPNHTRRDQDDSAAARRACDPRQIPRAHLGLVTMQSSGPRWKCASNYRKYRKPSPARPSPMSSRPAPNLRRGRKTRPVRELASDRAVVPIEGRGRALVVSSTAPRITEITRNGSTPPRRARFRSPERSAGGEEAPRSIATARAAIHANSAGQRLARCSAQAPALTPWPAACEARTATAQRHENDRAFQLLDF